MKEGKDMTKKDRIISDYREAVKLLRDWKIELSDKRRTNSPELCDVEKEAIYVQFHALDYVLSLFDKIDPEGIPELKDQYEQDFDKTNKKHCEMLEAKERQQEAYLREERNLKLKEELKQIKSDKVSFANPKPEKISKAREIRRIIYDSNNLEEIFGFVMGCPSDNITSDRKKLIIKNTLINFYGLDLIGITKGDRLYKYNNNIVLFAHNIPYDNETQKVVKLFEKLNKSESEVPPETVFKVVRCKASELCKIKSKKPPIGVLPKELNDKQRYQDLLDAIKRYVESCIKIPTEWIEELEELLELI